MKKKITAAYMHKLLKESLFSEVDLTRIPEMSDEERRAFNIQQLDRIIGMRSHADALGWFIGQFIPFGCILFEGVLNRFAVRVP